MNELGANAGDAGVFFIKGKEKQLLIKHENNGSGNHSHHEHCPNIIAAHGADAAKQIGKQIGVKPVSD